MPCIYPIPSWSQLLTSSHLLNPVDTCLSPCFSKKPRRIYLRAFEFIVTMLGLLFYRYSYSISLLFRECSNIISMESSSLTTDTTMIAQLSISLSALLFFKAHPSLCQTHTLILTQIHIHVNWNILDIENKFFPLEYKFHEIRNFVSLPTVSLVHGTCHLYSE